MPGGETRNIADWRLEGLTFSLATMASHREAEVTQAPIAGPFAATMMGLGKSRKASKTAWLLVLINPCSFLGCIG